jgi:hypothetical protein
MTNFAFNRWIDRLVEEKGIDADQTIEVAGASGANIMPLEIVINAIKGAPAGEQRGIQNMLIRIDFAAPGPKPIVDYFKHLAQAIAI